MASERSPLLSSSSQKTVKFYVGEEIVPVSGSEQEERRSCLLDPRSWGPRATVGAGDVESDAEYLSSESRASRTLPNNAPAPFVWLGLCCAILAGLCFTSSNVMVKYIPDVNSWQLLCVRCVSQLVAMVPVMVVGKHNILGTADTPTRLRVAAQGVLGGLLLLGIFEVRIDNKDHSLHSLPAGRGQDAAGRLHGDLLLGPGLHDGPLLLHTEGPLRRLEDHGGGLPPVRRGDTGQT